MEKLLEKLREETVDVNGIKMVPLSVINHEIENYEVLHLQNNLEDIQTDVRAILSTLQGEAKDLLND